MVYEGKTIILTILSGSNPGAITRWSDAEATDKDNTAPAGGADSPEDEVVRTTGILDFTINGLMTDEMNATTGLPKKGDVIAFKAMSGTLALLDTSEYNPDNIKVLQVKYNFEEGPAKYSITGRSGVLN